MIHRLGFPTPELQTVILDDRGHALGRCDFYWPQFGLVGEADGLGKYEEDPEESLVGEKRRQEAFEDTGLVVVRWGTREVRTAPLLGRKLAVGIARAQARSAAQRRWQAVITPAPLTLLA